MSRELLVGLDIGSSEVVAVIGRFNEEGQLEVIGIGSAVCTGVRRGVVINIASTQKAIDEALYAAEVMAGQDVFRRYGVCVSMAGGNAEGFNSRGVVAVVGKNREISQEDVDRVIEAARAVVLPMDRVVLHVLPQLFKVDEEANITDPVNMIGVRLEGAVHIITSTVSAVKNLEKTVERARLKVDSIMLEAVAASEVLLSRDEKELGVLFLDIGADTTDIMVFFKGVPCFTMVLPLGSHAVTTDISRVFKMNIDEAERLKLESGCCFEELITGDEMVLVHGVAGRSAREIPQLELTRSIQARMEEILIMVRDYISESGYLNALHGGVVLTGGGAMLKGCIELSQRVFGLPSSRLAWPQGLRGIAEYQNPRYSAAVGLLVQAARQQPAYSRTKSRSTGFWDKLKEIKDIFIG